MKEKIQTEKENSDKIYSDIEQAIIAWTLDGKKTAGALTREILSIKDNLFKTFVHTKIKNLYGTLRVEMGPTFDIGMDNGSIPHLLPYTATIEGIKEYYIGKGALKMFGDEFENAFKDWELREVGIYKI